MTTVTVWDGSSSTDWHTAANWSNGVPTTSLIASIPSAPSNQPTMSSDGTAHALQLDSGATLTGGSNITLYITGESAGETDAPPNGMAVNLDGAISGELSLNITTNATTSVDLNPTSGDIHDLTLASTGTSLIINSENTCTLTGDLTITKGKFNANSNNLSVAGTITVNSVAGGDAEIDIGDVVADCAKIAVESGDTITAAHSSNALTVDGNGIGTGRSIDFTGIISGTLDIICTHPNTTEADLSASSGVINHLTLNHASLVMKMNSSATLGNLTVSIGTFNTEDSGGSDKDLTVTGNTSLGKGASAGGADEATLTCNASTMSLGSTYSSDYGLYVKRGGTFVGGTGEHTMGSISMEDYATAKLTLTTHANGTTLNAGDYGSDYIVAVGADSTITSTNSLLVLATSKTEATYNLNLHDHFNNLTVNSSGKKFYIQQATTLAGNFTITAGDVDTTGSNHAITVTKHIDITGILTGNASAISTGTMTLRDNSSLVSTGTITITGNDKANSPSGAGFIWRNIETDGTAFAPTAGKVHFSGTDNNGGYIFESKFHDVDVTLASTGQDVAMSGVVGDLITIGGDLTVIEGTLKRNSEAHDITVTGDVEVQDGAVLGDNDETGATSFGSLTINSGGTYKATSGVTEITSNTGGGSSSALAFSQMTGGSGDGVFTHNNGTVKFSLNADYAQIISGSSTVQGPFYDVDHNRASASYHLYIKSDTTVEHDFDNVQGYTTLYGPNTLTLGENVGTPYSGSYKATGSGLRFYDNDSSNYAKVYGASVTTPFVYTGIAPDIDTYSTNASYTAWKWGDIQVDLTGDYQGGTLRLDGDMEFDAVTVNSGDTLDLNGQRAEFGGNLRIESGGAMKSTGGGLIVAAADVKILGSAEGIHDGDVNMIVEGGTHDWRNGAADGAAPWCRTVLVNGNVTHQDQLGPSSGASTYNPESVIVGNGKLTQSGGHAYLKDLTIATGGDLEMTQSTQKNIDLYGDLTMSGGLIGTSAVEFNGSDESAANASATTWGFGSSFSIEFWFKTSFNGSSCVLDLAPSSGNNDRIQVLQTASEMAFKLWNSTGTSYQIGTTAFTINPDDGKWHHLAFTSNGSTQKIYYDGRLAGEASHTITRAADPTLKLTIGMHSTLGSHYSGFMDELRFFSDVRTVGELRTDMFQGGTLADSGALVARYKFDEGTGTAIDNSQATAARDLVASGTGVWVGAGTFTYSTSTIIMAKSGTQTISCLHSTDIYNLTINDGSTTQLLTPNNDSGILDIYGDLTVNEKFKNHADSAYGRTRMKGAGKTITVGADVKTTALSDMAQMVFDFNGSMNIPELTTPKLILETNSSSILVATGDLTITTEIEIGSLCTFNANSQTITTGLVDLNGTGTLNINSSTLKFSSTNGLTSTSTNTLSASATTIEGNSKASKSTFESQNNFVVVGNVSNLNVTNEELKVTGMVTDCTGLIHQMNPTQDADQQLDKDTADDRDVQFASLDMDRNTELVG